MRYDSVHTVKKKGTSTMGKGKRNRTLHVENNVGAPKKQNKAKKQFVMPVWAKRALCIALLVAVLAGIIVSAVISGGAILRGRIIVESKTGKYDMNQQMATFILWQVMYQQASYEWQNAYYQQYFGGSTSDIVKNYQSPDLYGITMAAYYTKEVLNSGLYSIEDYLIEIVAGADAAEKAGLKFDANDKKDVEDVVSWVKNIYANLGFAINGIPFKNFLTEYVGEGFKTSDIEAAAKLMIMYSKYSDYMSFNLQDDPDQNTLQDYILKNPAGFFQTKYYSYTGATVQMMRDFFTDEFMTERFESTVAKHYANVDRLAVMDLKDEALTAKLQELGLTEAVKYTRTTGEDGEYTYSPELIDALADYIFGTSNKAGTFAAISGEKCAYLVYYKESSTATEATIAVKQYNYADYEQKLIDDVNDAEVSTIALINAALNASIVAAESTLDYKTNNEKAADLLAQLNADNTMLMPGSVIEVQTTKPATQNDTNTAPKSILDSLYAKDVNPVVGWNFVVNDTTLSYVVKVVDITKDESGAQTGITIQYVSFTDDFFASLLASFEAEFNLYLLESKVEAPLYSMTVDAFKEKVVNWLMDENFKELVLNRYANQDKGALLTAKADSNPEVLENKLEELFGFEGVKTYTKSAALEKDFETSCDSKVYEYIFSSKNADTATVITGKNDRVFLVYVAPVPAKDEEGHEGHDHTNTVHAAIKEYVFADYEEQLKYTYTKDEQEETKTFAEQIIADLLAEGRKNTTTYKSADDLAKAKLDALKAANSTETWSGTPATITKPAAKPADETNTAPQAIIDKIYPNGSSTKSITLTANTYYQVDDDGTSFVFKITEIDTAALSCKVEYNLFEDSEYYSYFRSIKSKLDSSFKETSTEIKYPDSITEGTYQDWLFKGEFKAAEGDNAATRTFDRVKDDLTFIASVDSSNNITSLTFYLVDEPAAQKNDEELTVYAAYQLYETEKDAIKALKKLNGLTGYDLLDMFTSFKRREEMGDNNEEGYAPGYVVTTSPTISVDMVKSDITDENLKNWLFDANRKTNDVEIIKTADGKGYYLAAFSSSEQAWTRNARSGWVNKSFEDHIKTLVGDYKINEEAMAKVEGVITTTTAAAK